MIPMSVVIIVRNEEHNLPRLLDSIQFSDDIVVVDSDSTDATMSIARTRGCRCFNRTFDGFGPQKRYAVEQARHEWVIVLDADEEVSQELVEQLVKLDLSQTQFVYRIRRSSFYLGRWIRHTEWSRDKPLRIFHSDHGNYGDDLVHETLLHDGQEQILPGPLLHYPYDSIAHHLAKIDLYTRLRAEDRSRNYGVASLLLRPPWKLTRNLILQRGFLDGWQGLVVCGMAAIHEFLKVARVLEKKYARHTDK